jgi:hypothetical protein
MAGSGGKFRLQGFPKLQGKALSRYPMIIMTEISYKIMMDPAFSVFRFPGGMFQIISHPVGIGGN